MSNIKGFKRLKKNEFNKLKVGETIYWRSKRFALIGGNVLPAKIKNKNDMKLGLTISKTTMKKVSLLRELQIILGEKTGQGMIVSFQWYEIYKKISKK